MNTTVPLIKTIWTVLDSVTCRNTQPVGGAEKLPRACCNTKRTRKHLLFKHQITAEEFILNSDFRQVSCFKLTVWEVEDRVVQLETRPCEGYLGCHNNSGRAGEQEEAFSVRLKAPDATQSGGKKTNKNTKTKVHFRLCLTAQHCKTLHSCSCCCAVLCLTTQHCTTTRTRVRSSVHPPIHPSIWHAAAPCC